MITSWKERVKSLQDAVWIASMISVPLSAISTVLFFGIWAMYGDVIIHTARQELGIDQNTQMILRALGEDRVIRQPYNLSYVDEPVRHGEDVLINLTVERTDYGASCTFIGGTSSFIKPNGIIIGGNELPIIRQVNRDLSRLLVNAGQIDPLFVSSTLIGERWAVFLILQYTCDDKMVIEETYPMPFILQPRKPHTGPDSP